jgi:hypothetical protein
MLDTSATYPDEDGQLVYACCGTLETKGHSVTCQTDRDLALLGVSTLSEYDGGLTGYLL